MKNERYAELREKWRAMIRTRDDRSEIVNYDDPSFPSYSFEGHLDGSSPWIRKAHWHDDIELKTVLTGRMAYNINGSLVTVEAGDSIFINAKQFHYPTDIRNGYCTYLITVIHPRILISSPEVESEYVLPVITNPDLPYLLFPAHSAEAAAVARLSREINDSAGNQFEITRCFFNIWHYVLQAAKTHIPEASAVNYEHIDSLKNMIGFIKGNYMDKLSLESIAAVGNMSKSSCNTIFKKYTSHTPNEYLIRYRLDKAMELLRTTDMPIGTISMECGFASASYMTEQFVKCYKMTPRDFRSSKR